MKEESQIEEMRAALRGDRERAEEARRRSTENVLTLMQDADPERREADPEPPRGFLARLLGRYFAKPS